MLYLAGIVLTFFLIVLLITKKAKQQPKNLGAILDAGLFWQPDKLLGHLWMPNYSANGIAPWGRLPASLSEIGTCLWLLIIGARRTTHPS